MITTPAILKTHETAVWFILMTLSVINFIAGGEHINTEGTEKGTVAFLLCLAFFKVRLVMRYFMEVRHATNELKISCELWLLGSFLLVTSFNVGLFN